MSKSLGNVVDPHKMSEEYGVDAFRYFLLREVPFGADGDFSEKALLTRYNAELANNLGNLFQRTATLTTKHFGGVIPSVSNPSSCLKDLPSVLKKIEKGYDELAFHDILENIYTLMIQTNKFIDDQAPWKLGPDQKDKIAVILVDCLKVVKALALLLYPFMPTKTAEIWKRLGESSSLSESGGALLNDIKEGKDLSFTPDQKVIKADPLFMRKGGRWK